MSPGTLLLQMGQKFGERNPGLDFQAHRVVGGKSSQKIWELLVNFQRESLEKKRLLMEKYRSQKSVTYVHQV